jgi:hypothetical protein
MRRNYKQREVKMLGRDFANTTSAIGARALQKATLRPNEPNLGVMLGDGLNAYNEQKKYNAYVEQLTNEHPEDAAKIAMNPVAYEKMLQENAAAERDQQFKMDMLKAQLSNSLALENARNAHAVGLAKLAAQLKGNATDTQDTTEQDSYDLAQNAINQLYDVAQGDKIGVFTDWRRNHGLTGNEVEQEYGKISAAVAGIAPRAISKLKAAGVSGINSLPEFMTYIGLPANPTSQQIMGAIPMMAQIAGVENPIKGDNTETKTAKFFNFPKGNLKNAVGLQVGQKVGGYTIERID